MYYYNKVIVDQWYKNPLQTTVFGEMLIVGNQYKTGYIFREVCIDSDGCTSIIDNSNISFIEIKRITDNPIDDIENFTLELQVDYYGVDIKTREIPKNEFEVAWEKFALPILKKGLTHYDPNQDLTDD